MDLTNTQLKINYWLVTHKDFIKRALMFFLIFLNVVFWGYSSYKWIIYIKETPQFRQAMKEMNQNLINWPDIHLKNKPQPLEILNIAFIPLGQSKYDLVAEINNPNLKWLVSNFDYKFFWSGGEVNGSSFILTSEKKFLLGLNIKSDVIPKDVNLEFSKINWNRIRPKKELPEFKSSDFLISNVFSDLTFKRISFSAKNNSPYSFWQVYFKVVLQEGKKFVAVNKIPVDKFLSGEERLVEIPFFQGFSSTAQIIIEPEVNVLDSQNIISLKDNIGEPK